MLTYLKNRHLNMQFNTEEDLSHRSMAKLQCLVQQLHDEYLEKQREQALPSLHIKQAGEGFKAWSHRGKIYLEAGHPADAVYGLATLMKAVQTPYLSEYLQEWHPHYPLRPVWLCADSFCAFSGDAGIFLPAYLQREGPIEEHPPFQMLCRYLLENGFNAIILGDYKGNGWHTPGSSVELTPLCRAFQLFGLKVILKPSFRSLDPSYQASFKRCPFDPHYRSHLTQLLREFHQIPCHGLLWETTYHHPEFSAHPLADEATFVEMMGEELQLIEESLPADRLCIYYLSSPHKKAAEQYAHWITTLNRRSGPRTVLAFSAVAGPLEADHLSLHPIWEALRRLPYEITTPLLPILNIGGLQQGEGVWPSLSLDLIEQTLSRCSRHHFVGFASLTSRIPASKGLLACQLWVAGQSLWKPMNPPWMLADIWFHAMWPDPPHENLKRWLKQIRNIIKELSALCQLDVEECQVKADALFSQLQDLSLQAQRSPSLFSHYFTYFYRDARRMILKTLQDRQLALSHLLIGQDMFPAFWTNIKVVENQGLKSHLNIQCHSKPSYDEKDLIMSQIYLENSLLD